MDKLHPFPYQDLRLKNLPGEKWKDIPGFDGAYHVSSYGRIRSAARMVTGRWKEVQLRSRMLRLRPAVTTNKTTGTSIYALIVTLSKDNVKSYFSVGRLVYHCFVTPIDLDDRLPLISFKDGDGRNTHFSNLFATTTTEILLKAYKNHRHKSHLSVLSKKVTQYDSQGMPIAWFPSFYEAAKRTGLEAATIAAAANHTGKVQKGFFWQTGHHKRKLSLEKLGDERPPDQGINTALQQRLGIRLSKGQEAPACINLSLKSMKGERWKPFPGYEGIYELSSMGRVKSLRRMSGTKRKVWVPEKIKKLTFYGVKGKNRQHTEGTAIVTLDKEDIKGTYSVARYVYYCFVAFFELNDLSLRVYYKDGDNSNLHYKNLVLKNAAWSINHYKNKAAESECS